MIEGSWTKISGTAAGTTTLAPTSSQFKGIFLNGTSAGTIAVHDVGTGAPAAGNQVFSVDLNTVGTSPKFEPIKFTAKDGLKAVHTGSSYNVTVIYE